MSVHRVEVLEIGGLPIPLASAHEIVQTYDEVDASFVHRMNSGSAVKHTHFRKLTTQIQGRGAIPAGLSELEYSAALVMRCIGIRHVMSRTRRILIPPERRTDTGYEPQGCFLINDVWYQGALTTISPSEFDVDLHPEATMYRVSYYPELIVFAKAPREITNPYAKEFNWTMEAVQL